MPDIPSDIQAAKDKLAVVVGVEDFDSQGFYVFTEREEQGVQVADKGLNATSSTAVHASLNSTQLSKFTNSLAQKITGGQDKLQLQSLLTKVYTNHPQAITNLERAFKDKFAQIARSYQKALGEEFDNKINEAYQQTITKYMPEIRQKFIESLKKSISKGPASSGLSLNLSLLNQQLDAQKESIYEGMEAVFLTKCNELKVPQADYDALEKALHTTTAFQEFKIFEITPYSANVIITPIKSSHDFSRDTDADERVIYCNGAGKPNCQVIRSPIPIPPEKSYKGKGFTKAEIKENQIQDTVIRLNRIATNQKFDSQKPIYECLLTSYHTGLKLWDGNEQTERANLLPEIQDRINLDKIPLKGVADLLDANNNNLYFPFLAPTNGFGEEIKTSTGFGGVFRNLKIEELAWRNNMALAMQLGTETQKNTILNAYKNYLNEQTNPGIKETLLTAIETVRTNMSFGVEEPKEKTLLKIMFKHNLHEKKEFARTAATLFCANADNQVIVGCKSGNERTAMILHRLEALYDGPPPPRGGAIKRFDKANAAPSEKKGAEKILIEFTTALEKQVNETNLYGTANHISSKDTGYDHKIASNSGYSLSTNKGESDNFTNLVTEGNGPLQAHTHSSPLKKLATPKNKPGLLASVWKYLKGLFSNSNSTLGSEVEMSNVVAATLATEASAPAAEASAPAPAAAAEAPAPAAEASAPAPAAEASAPSAPSAAAQASASEAPAAALAAAAPPLALAAAPPLALAAAEQAAAAAPASKSVKRPPPPFAALDNYLKAITQTPVPTNAPGSSGNFSKKVVLPPNPLFGSEPLTGSGEVKEIISRINALSKPQTTRSTTNPSSKPKA